MFKRSLFSAFVFLCLFIGCADLSMPQDSLSYNGGKSVAVLKLLTGADSTSTFSKIARSARLTISGPNMDSIIRPLIVTDTSIEGFITDIPAGPSRLFYIAVYDSLGSIQYDGSATTDIVANSVNPISLIITRRQNGSAIIIGSIEEDVDSATIPSVTIDPASVTVREGEPVTFSVVAMGGTGMLHYDWQKDGVSLGAPDQPSYDIAAVVLAEAGVYTVIVTDKAVPVPNRVIASATLIVNPMIPIDLTITDNPDDATVTEGDPVTFSVVAIGGEGILHYDWQKDGSSIGTPDEAYYIIPTATRSDAGVYTVVVTDDAGHSVISDPAMLTVSDVVIPADSTLVAYFPFSGDAGGVMVTGASLTTDRLGNENSAYSFNGSSNYIIDSTLNVFGTNPFTISFWIYYPSVLSTNQAVVSRMGGTGGWAVVIMGNSQQIVWCVQGVGGIVVSDENVITPNAWHHVVIVRDVNLYSFYYDDMNVQNNDFPDYSNYSLNVPLSIGANITSTLQQDFFNGKIDDIRIYSRALTEQEVVALDD